jgi:hypothetical protein
MESEVSIDKVLSGSSFILPLIPISGFGFHLMSCSRKANTQSRSKEKGVFLSLLLRSEPQAQIARDRPNSGWCLVSV